MDIRALQCNKRERAAIGVLHSVCIGLYCRRKEVPLLAILREDVRTDVAGIARGRLVGVEPMVDDVKITPFVHPQERTAAVQQRKQLS